MGGGSTIINQLRNKIHRPQAHNRNQNHRTPQQFHRTESLSLDIILRVPNRDKLDFIPSPPLADITPLVSAERERGVHHNMSIGEGLYVDAERGENPLSGADVGKVRSGGDVVECEGARFGEWGGGVLACGGEVESGLGGEGEGAAGESGGKVEG